MCSIQRFTPSRFTSLLRTVSTALRSFPIISCRTSSMAMFWGTLPPPLPHNSRDARAVSSVVFPQPFRPMSPYRRPDASVMFASDSRSGPPPLRLHRLKPVRWTSAALSEAVVISAMSPLAVILAPPSATPPPAPPPPAAAIPPSSSIILAASSMARRRSSSSDLSLISLCRSFLLSRSDVARGLSDASIMLA